MSHSGAAIARQVVVLPGLIEQTVCRAILGFIFLVLHSIAAADSRESPPAISETIPKLLKQFSRQGSLHVPELLPHEIAALVVGEPIVNAVDDPAVQQGRKVAAMGLLGFQVVDAPRLLVWLTLLGGSGRSDDRVTSVVLARMPAGSYVRYQHVNLPWPIRDRHWAILCEKNVELADASDGVIWEHRWALHETGEQSVQTAHAEGRIAGMQKRTLDASVYLPANRGTWALFDLGQNQTLILAFYDSDLGGRLPRRLVRSFTKRQLRKYLESTRDKAGNVHRHFDEQSFIHDGFGLPISRQDVIDAARAWKEP